MSGKLRRIGLALLATSLWAGLLVSPASAVTSYIEGGDAAAPLFNPVKVNAVDLQLSDQSIQNLWDNPRAYTEATFTLATDFGTFGPMQVGVHIKGQWGSFRDLNGKTGFKIKINAYVSDQRILGLKKLTLNNMVQDPSAYHEALTYRLFRSVGVPAPRVGYTSVHVNGTDYGLHANIETVDSIMMKRWVASTKHIYEGAYWTDVVPWQVGQFQVDDGDPLDTSDLSTLADINVSDQNSWFQRISAKVDMAELVQEWATEFYIGHWDGYANAIWNNYYLHSDDTGRFRMIPWGTDQTWNVDLDPMGNDGSAIMFKNCIQDQNCKVMYLGSLAKVQNAFRAGNYQQMAADITAAIASYYPLDNGRDYDWGTVNWQRQVTLEYLDRMQKLNRITDLFKNYGPGGTTLSTTNTGLVANLSWTYSAPAYIDTWFEVQWSTNRGGTWSPPAKYYSTSAQVALQLTQTRQFRVRTVNHVSAGAWSNITTITTPTLPKSPALRFSFTKGNLKVLWTKPVAAGVTVLNYQIAMSQDGVTWYTPVTTTALSNSYKLKKNQIRYFKLRMTTNYGITDWTKPVKVKQTL